LTNVEEEEVCSRVGFIINKKVLNDGKILKNLFAGYEN
jgi:hypothetical protein